MEETLNTFKRITGLALTGAMTFSLFTGCSKTDEFRYSDYLTEEGFFKEVDPAEYVTLPEYKGIEITEDILTASDESIQEKIDEVANANAERLEITDRAVEDGDTVNIDYVGSVDGEEFEGGSTEGNGTEVTIGVTSYIDDFLEQLIGHKPGENFDIEVTFPDEYSNNPDLEGKDAVFNVTINHIVEQKVPTIDDAYIKENLSDRYESLEDMKAQFRSEIIESQRQNYVWNYLTENSEVKDPPEKLIEFEKNVMLSYYESMVLQWGMDFETYLEYIGVESKDAFVEESMEEITTNAKNTLMVQAIAQAEGLKVEEEDIKNYFGVDDYSEYEDAYGIEYLRLAIMQDVVMEYVLENTVEA